MNYTNPNNRAALPCKLTLRPPICLNLVGSHMHQSFSQ